MKTNQAVDIMAALAHEGRLSVFRLLMRRAPDAVSAGDVAAALDLRAPTLSNQLAVLEAAGLVASRREGRQVLYAARTDSVGALIGYLASDCCRGRPEACAPAAAPYLKWERGLNDRFPTTKTGEKTTMRPGETRFNVLFLCTGNSARSIFAEAILGRVGGDRFRAFSGGARPKGVVNPHATHLLGVLNYDPSIYRSKSWEEFSGPNAPEMDFVFTVCDKAANEPCPVWPGQPMSAHWGVPDPAAVEGADAEIAAAFTECYRGLYNRLSAFTALPIESLDRISLQERLDEIAAPARSSAA